MTELCKVWYFQDCKWERTQHFFPTVFCKQHRHLSGYILFWTMSQFISILSGQIVEDKSPTWFFNDFFGGFHGFPKVWGYPNMDGLWWFLIEIPMESYGHSLALTEGMPRLRVGHQRAEAHTNHHRHSHGGAILLGLGILGLGLMNGLVFQGNSWENPKIGNRKPMETMLCSMVFTMRVGDSSCIFPAIQWVEDWPKELLRMSIWQWHPPWRFIRMESTLD